MQAEKRHRQQHNHTRRETRSHAAPLITESRPVVLCVGGSDSSGLAGLQMDARFCQAMNVHQACVVTAVTAQNNNGVIRILATSVQDCQAQFDTTMSLKPQAIKIGLIANLEQLQWIRETLASIRIENIPVIFDPVTVASSGDALAENTITDAITELLPYCDVLTPNLPEVEFLSHTSLNSDQDIHNAAQYFHQHGVEWVYIKGGHGNGETLRDIISLDQHMFALEQQRQPNNNLRGTGCALASSIASALALGYEMVDAMVIANMAVAEGIYHAKAVNHEAGPISAQGFPKSFWPHYVDLGAKQQEPMQCEFKDCTAPNTRIGGTPDEKADELGLYPVVDRYQWLERLLPLGIHTIQLRIKDLDGQALKEEIEKSIALARESNCRLFINDHWELAIEMGAYGIHLGQEDLDKADLRAISQAGLRLGISNHTHFELIRCLAINPSYIACGPVFATQSKDMPWIPHGLNGLRYWCESLMSFQNRPLVAIGGINRENISEVAQCGSSGIALISAITEAESPEKTTRELLQIIEHARKKYHE